MAGKINKSDIAASDLQKPFVDLNTTLGLTVAAIEKIIAAGVSLDKSIKTVNNTTSQYNKQQTQSKNNTDILSQKTLELEKIELQYSKTLAKVSASREKEGQQLQKLNTLKANQTRQSKLQQIALAAEAGSYKQISAQLSLNLIKYKKYSAAQRESSTSAKKLADTIKRQRDELQKVDKRLGTSTRNVGNYKSALAGTAKSLLGAFGVVGGLQMFARVLTSSVKSVVEFEKSLSRLQSVTGASQKGMAQLEANALRLGRETSKTASEVADLSVEFAKLGFTKNEIINLTESTINLSIATGRDLASAAALAGATMRQFGFESKDSGKVMDVMAKSFVTSALDIDKFETAMANAGPVAKNSGLSFERTTAILGKLSDMGIDASTAGTGLKNILLDLTKYGLTLDEALNQINGAANATGEAFNLFGKRGALVATVMAQTKTETAALTDTLIASDGSLKEMADTMENNMAGAATRFGSAWDGMVQKMLKSEGVIQRLIDSSATFLNVMTDANEQFSKSSVNAGKSSEELLADIEKAQAIIAEGNMGASSWVEVVEKAQAELKNRTIAASEAALEHSKKLNLELLKSEEALFEDEFDLELNGIEKSTKAQDAAAMADYNRAKELSAKKDKLNEENQKKILEGQVKLASDRLVIGEEQFGDFETQMDAELELFIDVEDKKREEIEKTAELEREINERKIDAAIEIANQSFEFSSTLRDRELADVEAKMAYELGLDSLTAEQKLEIETKYAKQIADIKRKQAIQDKVQGVFNAGINTALAITHALADPGGIPGGILAALYGVLGATQVATILAKPIPAYAKGTKNAIGGLSLVGEQGSELVQSGGQTYLTPDKPTLTYLDAGAMVTPALETQKMLAGVEFNRSKSEKNSELIELKNISRKLDVKANWTKEGFIELNSRTKTRNRRIDIWFK